MENKLSLTMKKISKSFGDFIANDNINLTIHGGEIHALLGENGAGKSTLMNILTGIYKPSGGTISLNGEKVNISSPKDAVALGIGMVHQHFQLIPTLSVAENIYLNLPKCDAILHYKKMEELILGYAKKFNLPLEPKAKVWQLSVGEQQRIEILKLLCRDTRILILDEPTAVLTPQEAKELFKALRSMAEEGKAVIVISHKMNEVMENADRITVLKSGRVEDSLVAVEATVERLTRAVVGDRQLKTMNRTESPQNAEEVLTLEDVCVLNDRGNDALKRVSFQLRAGEIFGIAGVAGSGQKELAEAIAGLRSVKSGSIRMKAQEITALSCRGHIEKGIAFIPEDRLKMGLVPEMNLNENAALKCFRQSPYSRHGILQNKRLTQLADNFISAFDIKHGGRHLPIAMMSGGNQQKLLIAREIQGNPNVIVAAYPVRGLDIGATEAIHEILMRQKASGAAILLISEELDEIFEMCDRVGVLCDGQLMGVKELKATSYDEIGRMMSGESA